MRRHAVIAFTVAYLLGPGGLRAQPGAQTEPPLIGEWQLNIGRTHYGSQVERRRSERFSCVAEAGRVRCTIRSERADGRTLTGHFNAPVDGTGAAVTGIPDVDEVRLQRPVDGSMDATFLSQGKPILGYRVFRSDDRQSLVLVAVHPVSRVALTTVVVYDRR